MLTKIRWKIAADLMEKAHEQIATEEVKNVKKGLRTLKLAIRVMPRDKVMLDYMRLVWASAIAKITAQEES